MLLLINYIRSSLLLLKIQTVRGTNPLTSYLQIGIVLNNNIKSEDIIKAMGKLLQ